ncbi:hypothetical protein V1511DRAFT_513463 [Dipodascopsis uninucleata]
MEPKAGISNECYDHTVLDSIGLDGIRRSELFGKDYECSKNIRRRSLEIAAKASSEAASLIAATRSPSTLQKDRVGSIWDGAADGTLDTVAGSSAGVAGRSFLPTPPEESYNNATAALNQYRRMSSVMYVIPDDDVMLENAMNIALECSPCFDPSRESFRILSCSRSLSSLSLAKKLKDRCYEQNPDKVMYMNLTHAVPLPMLHQYMKLTYSAPSQSTFSTSHLPSASDCETGSSYAQGISTHQTAYRLSSASETGYSPSPGYDDPLSAGSSITSVTSSSTTEFFSETLFESYVVLRQGLLVPPSSLHFSITISVLPTHVLPDFASFLQARIAELQPGCIMIIVYPVSLKFFYETYLKVLDPLLHSLLALNRISTTVCQNLSQPPIAPPSYAQQLCIIEQLGGKIISSEERDIAVDNWGQRWLSKEERWISDTLGSEKQISGPGIGIGSDVIEGINRGSEVLEGIANVGIHVIRKQ